MERVPAATLDEAVGYLTAQGYILVGRTGNRAQLRKPKRLTTWYLVLNCILAFVGLGLFLLALQLLLHLAAKDQLISVVEQDNGVFIEHRGWA